MRLGLDVRYLSHGLYGGIHTYLTNLLPPLLDLCRAHDVFLYADTKRPFELERLPPNAQVRLLPWRHPLSSVANDFALRRWMARDNLEVVHFPANYGFAPPGAATVLTVHDAINLMPLWEIVRGHPKTARTLALMTFLHLCTAAAVRRASLILTVSQHAAQEIARFGRVDWRRIRVAAHAPPPDLRRVQDEATLAAVRERHAIAGSFVLADALKNPAVLLRAWRRLTPGLRARYRIVFFSRQPSVPAAVGEAVRAGYACLLARPSRADLIALYSLADAFVFPSLLEGFGLPILEAMTCGAPVIASDRGAIPEVAARAALLVDAEDDQALAACLTRVLTDPAEAERLRQAGRARAAQFSWPRTARLVLDTYTEARRGLTAGVPVEQC